MLFQVYAVPVQSARVAPANPAPAAPPERSRTKVQPETAYWPHSTRHQNGRQWTSIGTIPVAAAPAPAAPEAAEKAAAEQALPEQAAAEATEKAAAEQAGTENLLTSVVTVFAVKFWLLMSNLVVPVPLSVCLNTFCVFKSVLVTF